MSREIITILKDDIDGSEATETIEFTFAGIAYSIDLSTSNADKFRKDVAKYIDNATRTGGRAARGTGAGRSKSSEDLDAIRLWARANGHEVGDRGRIKQDIKDAYYAANPS